MNTIGHDDDGDDAAAADVVVVLCVCVVLYPTSAVDDSFTYCSERSRLYFCSVWQPKTFSSEIVWPPPQLSLEARCTVHRPERLLIPL